jgi:hypothetical protein
MPSVIKIPQDSPASSTGWPVLSTSSDQFFPVVRSKVRGLDGNLPLYGMRTMDDQISNSLLIERLIASLSAVFGFLATLLGVIGL